MTSRNTDEIERELEHTRARVDSTLDNLQGRLSPGEMLDQALHYAKDGPADFGRNLGRQMRDNPLPVGLIGIGLAWLMAGNGSARRGDTSVAWPPAPGDEGYMAYKARTVRDDLAARARAAGESIRRQGEETQEAFDQRRYGAMASVLDVKQRSGETLQAFGDRIDAAMTSARSRFDEARAGIESGVRQAGVHAGDVRRRGREAGDSLMRGMEEQPLVAGAIGIALGAVIGSLLPRSRTEDAYLGPWRDEAIDRGREAAAGMAREAGAVGEAAASAARDEAGRQERESGSVDGKVRAAGEQLREAATRGASVAGTAARAAEDAARDDGLAAPADRTSSSH